MNQKLFTMTATLIPLTFTIEASNTSPHVFLKSNGEMYIQGRYIDHEPYMIGEEIKGWLNRYSFNPAPLTTLEIDMEYLSCDCAKYFFGILKIFKEIQDKGFDVHILWRIAADDEGMLATVRTFEDSLEMGIVILGGKELAF